MARAVSAVHIRRGWVARARDPRTITYPFHELLEPEKLFTCGGSEGAGIEYGGGDEIEATLYVKWSEVAHRILWSEAVSTMRCSMREKPWQLTMRPSLELPATVGASVGMQEQLVSPRDPLSGPVHPS